MIYEWIKNISFFGGLFLIFLLPFYEARTLYKHLLARNNKKYWALIVSIVATIVSFLALLIIFFIIVTITGISQ